MTTRRRIQTGASEVQKSRAAEQTRIVLGAVLCAALLAGAGLGHTACRIAGVQAGYRLGQVEREYRELLREHEHLKMERATQRSAQRLEAVARTRLGRAAPSASQLVVMKGKGAAAPGDRAQSDRWAAAQRTKANTTAAP